ncbi:MAG TPA: phage baseplate assembly protein V [Flavipsychrobacter sp.]|nr:phage baseplate assembly protein V [Flavipsychrobacter sp.]
MAQQISVEITINGKKISPFSFLSLRQQLNGHHQFEIRFNHDVLEEKHSVTIDKSRDFLGKPISIAFNTFHKSKSDHVFKGIVTDISISNNLASPGDLVFRGYSPTILLETGENNQSHLQRSLNQIVKDTIGSIPSNDMATKVNPVKKSSIPYVVQYRESNFNFIRRIAAEYGEWFYYDGSNLIFGSPGQSETVNLEYPNDISDINLQMRIAPVNFEQVGYISKENTKLSAKASSQQVSGLDNFGKHALKTSEQIYNIPTTSLSKRKFTENKELDESVKVAKASNASDLVQLQAGCDSPFVKLGGQVHVKAEKADYGKFIVTSVVHTTDGLGNYHNEFEAIPSTITVPPNPHYEKPIAESQMAVVTDNKDPDNLGKVKVQLLWQKSNASTPWIRVLTPHSGMRNGDKTNRGVFFTPEVGDYVIVGFTQNDPDRPFVMGSIPHGKAINTQKNTDNHVKAIRTRMGSTIYFHDKENSKEQEIRIETDVNNYISVLVNNSNGDIKIYSSKAIEVNSKESIIVQSGKTINVKSEKISIEASDSISMKANQKIEIKGADVIIEGSKTFAAKGGTSAKVESAQIEVKASASAKVSGGATLDLEGGGMANLKAGLVKIN